MVRLILLLLCGCHCAARGVVESKPALEAEEPDSRPPCTLAPWDDVEADKLPDEDLHLIRTYSNLPSGRPEHQHLSSFRDLWCGHRITVEARLVGLLGRHGVRVSKWHHKPHYTLRQGEKVAILKRVTHALLDSTPDYESFALSLLES